MLKKTFLFMLACFLIVPAVSYAQETTLVADTETFEKAKVTEIVSSGTENIPGTDAPVPVQTIKAEILSGEDKGRTVTIKNDYIQLETGDVFYARHQTNELESLDNWSVAEPYRLTTVFWVVAIFIILLFVFGGRQGMRGLASLIGSFFLIFYILIPNVYEGRSAILVSIGVASLIIVVGSYITHGVNRTTTSAVLGMIATVLVTGIGAYYAVDLARLSGYSTEEAVYLTIDTRGAIDLAGLLFGGIMIGLLGVLYDSAIGQAVAIEELFRAGKHMSKREIYLRAIRIGREHIGALVNTLAIAYVGAALPLLLLLQTSTVSLPFILNSEIISTEILRIFIGSIGLVLAVPITTFIATYMLHGKVADLPGNHAGHRH